MGYLTTAHILQPGSICHEKPNMMMTLNAINTSKGRKSFTTFKQAIDNPIILEIIFEADDGHKVGVRYDKVHTSSAENVDGADLPGKHNSNKLDDVDDSDEEEGEDDDEEDDEEEEEEDDDGDDDEEDGDNNEEDGETDEDEERVCESDSDSDDEEEDDNNIEDFSYGLDEDFHIEFRDSNEDDGLIVEFEETSDVEDVPPPPPAPEDPIPFWFTNEEDDQIRLIFELYQKTLDIEKQRRACIRSPTPFVGRICRTPLKPVSGSGEKFTTLDKVEVFLRELYPLGTILPPNRVVWLLTTWDSNDGVPLRSVELSKSNKKATQKRAQINQTSILYCAPVFMTKNDYQYTVSSQDSSLMYASNSSTNVSISRFSPFLPEKCRIITFSLD